ncbi:transcription factor-like 5 protein [Dendropsophus ebraccatus]|uniref:transcription factor-like 5 protein n=1 Tax=Dendropsophus ebraccatus TaxID=150705 RepID=UPI003831FA47
MSQMTPAHPACPTGSPACPPGSPARPPRSPARPPRSPARPPRSTACPPRSPTRPPRSTACPTGSPACPPRSPARPPRSTACPPRSPTRPPRSTACPTGSPACPPRSPTRSPRSPACPTGEVGVNTMLSDTEYTQLQQLLCSHIDPQGNAETGVGSILPATAPQYQPTSLTTEEHNVYGAVQCQSDNSIVHANQTSGRTDLQEPRLMMLSESISPPPGCGVAEKQPVYTSGDSSGAVPMQLRLASDIIRLHKENETLGDVSGVRTEERWLLTDVRRCTEVPEDCVTNNLVTIVCHPSQLTGAQPVGSCSPVVKINTAQSALQLVYSDINLQSTAPDVHGICQTCSSLNCGASCPLLETAKNQEISLSRGFSFCYQQNTESIKQNPGLQNKVLSEEILVKVKDTTCRQSIKKRSCVHLAYANMERRVLGDISNTHLGAAAYGNASEQGAYNMEAGLSQRREKHNHRERERRRRIRVHCDELNNLVPFCSVDTDKATTLQWTVAFLRYLQEKHGEPLRKDFEAFISTRTEKKMKITTRPSPVVGAGGKGSR